MATRKTPRYITLDGYRYPEIFLAESVRTAINYQPQPSDIFVVTYPKCGTTWMQQIVFLILYNGEMPFSTEQYFSHMPFLELHGAAAADRMLRPGCIRMHLPFHIAPYSSQAKYIYVARNPKDCCVSFYHHTKFFPMYRFSDGNFDDFFEVFIRGETDFNDYFGNLLSWYEHRNDHNIFFITYEQMKADPRSAVLKVAEFLGEQYARAVMEDEKVMNNILYYSSFKYMKENVNDAWKNMFIIKPEDIVGQVINPVLNQMVEVNSAAQREGHVSVGDFIRNGVIGEWKGVMSPDQKRRINERIIKKTRHSDVMSLWSNV